MKAFGVISSALTTKKGYFNNDEDLELFAVRKEGKGAAWTKTEIDKALLVIISHTTQSIPGSCNKQMIPDLYIVEKDFMMQENEAHFLVCKAGHGRYPEDWEFVLDDKDFKMNHKLSISNDIDWHKYGLIRAKATLERTGFMKGLMGRPVEELVAVAKANGKDWEYDEIEEAVRVSNSQHLLKRSL